LEGESFLTTAYAKMVMVLPQLFPDTDNPQLVIAFDEAHSLSEKSSKGLRPSHILCRTINAYSRATRGSIWVVFASTTSQVADFSAPQPLCKLFSIHQLLFLHGILQTIPFAWLQQGIYCTRLIRILDGIRMQTLCLMCRLMILRSSNISPDSVAHCMSSCFCALLVSLTNRDRWKSLMAVGGENINSIMTTASQKLSKSNIFDATVENQALAVLSQRFALDVCFGHPDAASYIEKGVASHMRTCLSTTEDRTWTFTSYPSEPLLSCAAANMLYQHTDNLTQALGILKKKVDGGMFEIGQSGELTSRLVLLLAKDKYVRKHHDVSNDPYIRAQGGDDENWWKAELIDCQKVSVIHFLEHVFGDSFWSRAGNTAKELFQHAYINFSHWVPMDGLISPGTEVR